jgi:hypothetical protein
VSRGGLGATQRSSRRGLNRHRWFGSRWWAVRSVTSAAAAKPHIVRALSLYVDECDVRSVALLEQALKDALMELRRDRPFD